MALVGILSIMRSVPSLTLICCFRAPIFPLPDNSKVPDPVLVSPPVVPIFEIRPVNIWFDAFPAVNVLFLRTMSPLPLNEEIVSVASARYVPTN